MVKKKVVAKKTVAEERAKITEQIQALNLRRKMLAHQETMEGVAMLRKLCRQHVAGECEIEDAEVLKICKTYFFPKEEDGSRRKAKPAASADRITSIERFLNPLAAEKFLNPLAASKKPAKKKKGGRPKKAVSAADESAAVAAPAKKRGGRPKKAVAAVSEGSGRPTAKKASKKAPKVAKKRGRKPKNQG